MQLVKEKISIEELKKMSEKMFEGLVKAVVDVEQQLMVVDAGLHSDQEAFLLENESKQDHLWGINLYPVEFGKKSFIVFDSMINLRPSWGNRSRSVDDLKTQEKIREIVNKLVVL